MAPCSTLHVAIVKAFHGDGGHGFQLLGVCGEMSSDYARNILAARGWQDGDGLGRDKSGRSEALKVKLKFDKAGVRATAKNTRQGEAEKKINARNGPRGVGGWGYPPRGGRMKGKNQRRGGKQRKGETMEGKEGPRGQSKAAKQGKSVSTRCCCG